jgi:hypothetical protein
VLIECDVVLSAPFRRVGKGRGRSILLYILIEHQSEPERIMPLRALEYVATIYRYQERQWRRTHGSSDNVQFMPVLPIVFYTRTRTWESLGRLRDLVEEGEEFGDAIPDLEPIFVNLRALTAEQLAARGGFFGRVLRVVQQRHAPPDQFADLLQEEVAALEALRTRQRPRWLALLSYLTAFVYHDRVPDEQEALRGLIEEAVPTAEDRQEVQTVARTIADMYREEGEKKGELRGLRRLLVDQLQEKFGDLPPETVAAIRATTSVKLLTQWGKRLVSATTLQEVGIKAPS